MKLSLRKWVRSCIRKERAEYQQSVQLLLNASEGDPARLADLMRRYGWHPPEKFSRLVSFIYFFFHAGTIGIICAFCLASGLLVGGIVGLEGQRLYLMGAGSECTFAEDTGVLTCIPEEGMKYWWEERP